MSRRKSLFCSFNLRQNDRTEHLAMLVFHVNECSVTVCLFIIEISIIFFTLSVGKTKNMQNQLVSNANLYVLYILSGSTQVL